MPLKVFPLVSLEGAGRAVQELNHLLHEQTAHQDRRLRGQYFAPETDTEIQHSNELSDKSENYQKHKILKLLKKSSYKKKI